MPQEHGSTAFRREPLSRWGVHGSAPVLLRIHCIKGAATRPRTGSSTAFSLQRAAPRILLPEPRSSHCPCNLHLPPVFQRRDLGGEDRLEGRQGEPAGDPSSRPGDMEADRV